MEIYIDILMILCNIYFVMYIVSMCVCVCVYVERERERYKDIVIYICVGIYIYIVLGIRKVFIYRNLMGFRILRRVFFFEKKVVMFVV